MEVSLLKTKLHAPGPRSGLVSRPHLIERLDQGVRRGRKLTLVSAPAGFGKTTLIAGWLRHADRPAAWLSLDEGDNDPVRFWRYVVAAVQTLHAALGQAVLAALQSPRPPALESLLTVWINDLALAPNPFVLVLDDYHVITEEAIHHSLDFLLGHLPPQLHLVIATRADPPLSLPRRRGRAELAEVRAADLAFTGEETAVFLNVVSGLDLAAEDVAALEARTEGWIVGLQMAAIALRSLSPEPVSSRPAQGQAPLDRHAFVAAFAGDDRYIFDYLVEEVLSRQPPYVQSFLLQTSILERFCGSLCDAVTARADSQEMLDYLERANLFTIPLDNRRQWYRYHHLFAGLLRHRLRQGAGRAEIASMHLRASEWYEGEGLVAEAVSQALAVPECEHAVRLIERHGLHLLYRGEVLPVQRWLQRLPEALRRSRPWLCVLYGWSEFLASWSWYTFDVAERVEPWLREAERALSDRSYDPAGLIARLAIRPAVTWRRCGHW
jgi:LuxR family maltose regulon positive regulatory protein